MHLSAAEDVLFFILGAGVIAGPQIWFRFKAMKNRIIELENGNTDEVEDTGLPGKIKSR